MSLNSITDVNAGDVFEVKKIFNSALVQLNEPEKVRLLDDEMAKRWLDSKIGNKLPTRAYRDDVGKLIGFCYLTTFRSWPIYDDCSEISIYVADGSRKRGIGSALISSLCIEARKINMVNLIACIECDNQPSKLLHLKSGFKFISNLPSIAKKRTY